MEFRKAYDLMKNKGQKIKLPTWSGYWAWENDTIMMHCKDGRILDIRQCDDVAYTIDNINSDKWEVVTLAHISSVDIVNNTSTFNNIK